METRTEPALRPNMTRVDWLRGEATALSFAVVEQELAVAFDAVAESTIMQALSMASRAGSESTRKGNTRGLPFYLPLAEAELLAEAFNTRLFAAFYPSARGEEGQELQTVERYMARYAFNSNYPAFAKEIGKTTVAMPLNLLWLAETSLRTQRNGQTFFADLAELSDTLASPWFKSRCNEAAFAANGFWGEFSTFITPFETRVRHLEEAQQGRFTTETRRYEGSEEMTDVIALEFETGQERPQFQFRRETLEALQGSVAQRNAFYNKHLRRINNTRYSYHNESYRYGLTDGCPARHLQVQARGNINAFQEIAAMSGQPVDELFEPHEATALELSLDLFANYLRRADQIRQDAA